MKIEAKFYSEKNKREYKYMVVVVVIGPSGNVEKSETPRKHWIF